MKDGWKNKTMWTFIGGAATALAGSKFLKSNTAHDLAVKGFELNTTFSYSLGGYAYDGVYATLMSNNTPGSGNWHNDIENRWQKPGDVTDVPRFVLGQAAGPQNSSRYVHSTDHLRVKNLTLGFTLPDQWLTKLGVSKARLYFSGSNLLTWAKWNQYDPEVPVSGEVFCETPPMRTYSFGIEVSF